MSRWWRAYDQALDDPKLQKLEPDLFKAWFNLMCLASQHGGTLPPIPEIAFRLRMTEEATRTVVDNLVRCHLLDRMRTGLRPHSWDRWQYQSDTSAERTKNYRDRKRKQLNDLMRHGVTDALRHNVTQRDVTVTFQNRTEQKERKGLSNARKELIEREGITERVLSTIPDRERH